VKLCRPLTASNTATADAAAAADDDDDDDDRGPVVIADKIKQPQTDRKRTCVSGVKAKIHHTSFSV